jgi:signal transduction histidine kinase
MLAVAVLYVVAARLGLTLDAVGGFATVVWAPTGIALAAILLFGHRLWPGVFAGALAANLLTGASIPAALGIGVGNTLEAVLGAWALRRFPNFRTSLDRLGSVLPFLLVATVAPFVSATLGVLTLSVSGSVASATIADTWRAWWVGDFIGALLVAPFILVWRDFEFRMPPRARAIELAALALAVTVVAWFVFYGRAPMDPASFVQAYIVFPVLIWAAVRFGQRGSVTASFMVSLTALGGAVAGTGPFVRADLHQSLFALQTFMGIVAASFLVLGATLAEREHAREEMRRALAAEAESGRAKADFIAIMSHELRAPLTAIAGYVELLAKGVNGPVNMDQTDALNRVQRNQDHLATLVDDVLNFTRLEATPISTKRQRVLASAAFDGVEPIVQPEMRRKHIVFERHPFDATLAVSADPDRLRQILVNFVANAVKYTADGGNVGVGAKLEAGRVRLYVSDSGVGIPADQLTRVFDPFFRVPHQGVSAPGVGLGLTIARDLARVMGGEIALESVVGQGTTVSVMLPSA